MPFDGAERFGKVAAFSLIGWVCAAPFIGQAGAVCSLVAILYVLYHLLNFYNLLEQRDLDEMELDDDSD